MRRMTFLRSSSFRSSIFVCVCLLVTIGLQQSDVTAATPTPWPTAAVTFGAIITNTPNPTLAVLSTGTQSPTPDYSGCPDGEWSQTDLSDDWAAFCAVCIHQDEPTAIVQIPVYHFGTVAALGTANLTTVPTNTAAATYPPLFVATPTNSNTATPTATYTPAPTVTPAFHEVYWDFRLAQHSTVAGSDLTFPTGGLSGYCGVSTATFPASTWAYGTGWNATGSEFVPGVCGGHGFAVNFPNFSSLEQSNPYDFALYVTESGGFDNVTQPGGFDWAAPSDVRTCAAAGVSARCDGYRVAWDYATEPDISDLRGIIVRSHNFSGDAFHLVGMSYSYTGDDFVEGDDPTPTASPPTATAGAPVLNCHDPQYKDVSVPIAGIDIDTNVVETDCYLLVPEIDSSSWILDVGFRIDGLEVCVDWHTFPTISFFGITFAIDLILILPVAYVVRRLLTF